MRISDLAEDSGELASRGSMSPDFITEFITARRQTKAPAIE
jgi:hypothetical protein